PLRPPPPKTSTRAPLLQDHQAPVRSSPRFVPAASRPNTNSNTPVPLQRPRNTNTRPPPPPPPRILAAQPTSRNVACKVKQEPDVKVNSAARPIGVKSVGSGGAGARADTKAQTKKELEEAEKVKKEMEELLAGAEDWSDDEDF
ncbi:hypothetical protein P7C70_g4282, partial [Phenoliferia sp. Uapishka_3]